MVKNLEHKSFNLTLGKSASPLQCIWSGTTTDTDPWGWKVTEVKNHKILLQCSLEKLKRQKICSKTSTTSPSQ